MYSYTVVALETGISSGQPDEPLGSYPDLPLHVFSLLKPIIMNIKGIVWVRCSVIKACRNF